MKHLIFNKLAAIVILVIFSGGCINTVNQEQSNSDISKNSFDIGPKDINGRAIHHAFKGIELYSWQNESGQWCFSLMLGTNRDKLYSEVIAPELRTDGIVQLKTKLGTLAKGEYVSWLDGTFDQPNDAKPKLILPPDDVINEIIAYCNQQEIEVTYDTDIPITSDEQAMARALLFTKQHNLDWGQPLRLYRTVSNWYAVEFAGINNIVLIDPSNGHAELPMLKL